MPDAEVIAMGDPDRPLGTRGRPGRGSGRARPSSSSRDLAPKPRRKPEVEPHPVSPPSPETVSAPPPQPPVELMPAPEQPVEPAAAPPTREPAQLVEPTGPGAGGLPGIPVREWAQALTTAAQQLFGEAWERRLAEVLAFCRRRLTGDYEVDDFGFDPELAHRFFLTALRPIAQKWFRIEVRGLENIPATGGALIVSNHSGTLPIDGLMTAVTINDHTGRDLRPLAADLVFSLPGVSELVRKGGGTLACQEDAERLLRAGELVGVWPEGFKGIGKPFSQRYKLQRFGRGGFVSAAVRTGVPIVPTSVVGAEEIYPLIGNVPSLARLVGVPYLPITPFFPLLGPLGMIPLPSKWLIEFGEPIRTDDYSSGAADDPMLVFNITDQVRESIQQTLYSLLMQRSSVFGR